MGYRDVTWCSNPQCDNSCGRQFTDEDHVKATKWWGSEDYPLVTADYHQNVERQVKQL